DPRRSPHAMRIYLDHNATAPLGPEVREAMLRFLGPPANPSSAHREGARARSALETARAQVAALVGAAPAEIVLTSGATEANNLAVRGTAAGLGIVTTAIEHASVLETARAVGAPLTVVPVDGEGRVDAGRGGGRGGPAGPRGAAGARGRRAGRRPSASAWRPSGRAPSWRRMRPPPRDSSSGCGRGCVLACRAWC